MSTVVDARATYGCRTLASFLSCHRMSNHGTIRQAKAEAEDLADSASVFRLVLTMYKK